MDSGESRRTEHGAAEGPGGPEQRAAEDHRGVPEGGAAPDDHRAVERRPTRPATPIGGPRDLRVGDAERTAAMSALGRHLEAGRITVDEYGDRSAEAASAVTRSDLARLFDDLPAPHPPLATSPPHGDAAGPVPAPWDRGRHPAPIPAIAAALGLFTLVPLVMALAFAGVHVPGLLFLPLFFMVIGGVGRHRRGPRGW